MRPLLLPQHVTHTTLAQQAHGLGDGLTNTPLPCCHRRCSQEAPPAQQRRRWWRPAPPHAHGRLLGHTLVPGGRRALGLMVAAGEGQSGMRPDSIKSLALLLFFFFNKVMITFFLWKDSRAPPRWISSFVRTLFYPRRHCHFWEYSGGWGWSSLGPPGGALTLAQRRHSQAGHSISSNATATCARCALPSPFQVEF